MTQSMTHHIEQSFADLGDTTPNGQSFEEGFLTWAWGDLEAVYNSLKDNKGAALISYVRDHLYYCDIFNDITPQEYPDSVILVFRGQPRKALDSH